MLLLKSRHKDGFLKERTVQRITYSMEQFDRALTELVGMSVPGERLIARMLWDMGFGQEDKR